jgi:hypothetical protein
MPPKLEDKVSPQELLSAMRLGILKNVLAKKYRASDEDFALMLYPMYRRGEVTKQEFNDFFNLVPITSGKADQSSNGSDQAADAPRQEPEEPEDIFRTITASLDLPPEDIQDPIEEAGELDSVDIDQEATFEELPNVPVPRDSGPVISDDDALKALSKAPEAPVEAPKAQKIPDRPPLEPPQKRQLSIVAPGSEKGPTRQGEDSAVPKQRDPAPRVETQPAAAERAKIEAPPQKSAEVLPAPKSDASRPSEPKKQETSHPLKPAPQTQPEPKSVQPAKQVPVAKAAQPPQQGAKPVDWSKLKSLFESMLSRLNSIEARLAKIEKKLSE